MKATHRAPLWQKGIVLTAVRVAREQRCANQARLSFCVCHSLCVFATVFVCVCHSFCVCLPQDPEQSAVPRRALGSTGLQVSVIGFGSAPLGSVYDPVCGPRCSSRNRSPLPCCLASLMHQTCLGRSDLAATPHMTHVAHGKST